ncbi:probable leucine-rich repeat receptor-like protein kinase At1g35710 [Rhododendron vialii]|uniref:probable leucine-rich repeat receptor-like protein kinase At1g35710 n=1 Tax=Rhododendron vialii TaxID=182163 RepID=UPI00265D8FA1|nr:probable leucine-rich repeat receptor-like protein kinase At1g35710 [Rhododendron vialii]
MHFAPPNELRYYETVKTSFFEILNRDWASMYSGVVAGSMAKSIPIAAFSNSLTYNSLIWLAITFATLAFYMHLAAWQFPYKHDLVSRTHPSGVDIYSSLPNSLTNLSSLTTLDLSSTKLLGNLPDSIGYLKSTNQLTGPIPFNLSGLQNLCGVIPPWLFTLPSLINIDLSSNHLTGQISEFQDHLQLDTIDLIDNKLHGPIPQSISTLVNITGLYLASNDLSGIMDLQTLENVEYVP